MKTTFYLGAERATLVKVDFIGYRKAQAPTMNRRIKRLRIVLQEKNLVKLYQCALYIQISGTEGLKIEEKGQNSTAVLNKLISPHLSQNTKASIPKAWATGKRE